MLDSAIQAQLETHLAKLVSPIELVVHADGGAKAQGMRALLRDIAALSDKVSLREEGADKRRPSFSIARVGEAPRIRFAGIPLGHEFTSLVLALLQASGHPPRIEPDMAERVRALQGELRFETYVSLSCQNCPDVVQALNAMAALNPNVTHVMIDGALFQDEVERRNILSVPATFLNGEPFAQGRMSLGEILAKVDAGGARRAAEKLAAKAPFDVLIVGGGPAGAAAAVYAAR
ncbi:MAG: thioredoxin family protein, partial [Burkholderiales bacterium]|nr:thioredoxin family protein [Burkholderiales bacterium]